MRKLLLLLGIFCFISASGQEITTITRSFRAKKFLSEGDTTLFVNYYFKNNKIIEIHIDCLNNDIDVKSSYFMNCGDVVFFIKNWRISLIQALEKFDEWSKNAIEHKVVDFEKKFGNIKNVMTHCVYDVKNEGIFTSMYGGPKYHYKDMTPTFVVTSQGRPYIFIGSWAGNAFQYEAPKGYIPSVWSMILTDAAGNNQKSYKFHVTGIKFYDNKNLETLINALDFDAVKLEYAEKIKGNKKKEELYNDIFK